MKLALIINLIDAFGRLDGLRPDEKRRVMKDVKLRVRRDYADNDIFPMRNNDFIEEVLYKSRTPYFCEPPRICSAFRDVLSFAINLDWRRVGKKRQDG